MYPFALLPDSLLFLLDDLLNANLEYCSVFLASAVTAGPPIKSVTGDFTTDTAVSADGNQQKPSLNYQTISSKTSTIKLSTSTIKSEESGAVAGAGVATMHNSRITAATGGNGLVWPAIEKYDALSSESDCSSRQTNPNGSNPIAYLSSALSDSMGVSLSQFSGTLLEYLLQVVYPKILILASPRCSATLEWKEGMKCNPTAAALLTASVDSSELETLMGIALVGLKPTFETMMHFTTKLLKTLCGGCSGN